MHKTFRIYLFIALIFAANSAFAVTGKLCPPAAEKPTPEITQAAMRSARDHGFLWRISKAGHTSFLYGTIHVAKFAWMFPGPVVTEALRDSDTVALELDMLDPNIQNQLSKGLALLHRTELPPALVKRMRQQADAVCITYDEIAGLTPEFQVDTLTLMVGTWDKLYAEFSIDGALAVLGH